MIAGRIWPKLTVLRWNTLLNAVSFGRTAFKIYIKIYKLFILDSRYVAKPFFSSARLIACLIRTKSSYTPSTALLVHSQRVLQAFRTFFATTDLAFSDSFILRHDSCAFTKRAVRLGNLTKKLPELQKDSFDLCDVFCLITRTSTSKGQFVTDTVHII